MVVQTATAQLRPNLFHMAFQHSRLNAYTSLLSDQSPVNDYQAFNHNTEPLLSAAYQPEPVRFNSATRRVSILNPFQSPVTPQPPSYEQAKTALQDSQSSGLFMLEEQEREITSSAEDFYDASAVFVHMHYQQPRQQTSLDWLSDQEFFQ
jgi:hypothetical protein